MTPPDQSKPVEDPTDLAERGPRGRWIGVGLWLAACCLALGGIWTFERHARIAELTGQSERLHAVVSRRTDQHDAHITALSAVAVAGAAQRPDLFREVAAAVMRFYPRITGVALVPLDAEAEGIEIGAAPAGLQDRVRAAARQSTGAPVLVPMPAERAYLIVKRSPNTDAARYGLALTIDAERLLEDEAGSRTQPAASVRLAMPDGTPILFEGQDTGPPMFEKPLASRTQPLRLLTATALHPGDLLPPVRVALVLAGISL
ncbi:hypothetical protein AB0T83_19740, partial [Fluviibacterium sp. DFM31]